MEKKNIKDNLGLVVAKGRNNEIGYKRDLIWRIKEDLLFFKKVTMGSYMIMGSKTFLSMPKKLPGRRYIILSRNREFDILPEHLLFDDMGKVLEFVDKNKEEKFNVVGGGVIYNNFLPYVSKMHITEIDDIFKDADTYFPQLEDNDWIKKEEPPIYSNEHNVNYRHTLYLRKK